MAARPQLQGRRHPADRAVRQDRPAGRARRAPAGEAPQPRDGRLPRPGREARLRPRHRHVRHDSQPRRAGARRRTAAPLEELRNRRVQRQGDAPAAQAPDQPDLEERLAMPGLDPRRADLSVAGVRAARHDPPAARRRGVHALRPGAARRARPRLHPPQQRAHPQGRALSGRPPPQRRSSSASGAATGPSTRSRSRGSR